MSKYKTVGTAGGNLKLLFPTMSKWESDECSVVGTFLGMGEMKTKIGVAELLNLKLEEINVKQEANTEYPPVKEGEEASLMINGSFRNNFSKLVERFGEVMTLPDGTAKVENGEIVKALPTGTLLRISRKGLYDSPMRKDCVNVVIEILEKAEEEVAIDLPETDI